MRWLSLGLDGGWMWTWLLSATSTPEVPAWVWVVVSGAGSVAVTVLSGKIVVPTFAYNREKERADKLEAEVMRLNADAISRVIPALEAQSQAVRESSAMVKEAIAALGRRRAS